MKKPKGKAITVRPDTIVEARYTLNPRQNDVLDIVLSAIKDDDDINQLIYKLNIKDYVHLFPAGRRGNVYRDFQETVEMFENSPGFKVFYPDGSASEYFNWFSRIKYLYNKGVIEIEIGQTFKKLLIEMKRATYYKPQLSICLTNTYSKRIYYMLKQFEDTGLRFDNLDRLREKLECPKSYTKYGLFKNKVLEVVKKEINEKTDILIDYKAIKEKNKVTKVEFSIKRKENLKYLVTDLQIFEEDYIELIKSAETLLPLEKEKLGEKYLLFCISLIDPSKIKLKTAKKAYVKKVLSAEQNITDFLKRQEKDETVEKNRKESLEAWKAAENVVDMEDQEKKEKLMHEYGAETLEELSKILADKYNLKNVI